MGLRLIIWACCRIGNFTCGWIDSLTLRVNLSPVTIRVLIRFWPDANSIISGDAFWWHLRRIGRKQNSSTILVHCQRSYKASIPGTESYRFHPTARLLLEFEIEVLQTYRRQTGFDFGLEVAEHIAVSAYSPAHLRVYWSP